MMNTPIDRPPPIKRRKLNSGSSDIEHIDIEPCPKLIASNIRKIAGAKKTENPLINIHKESSVQTILHSIRSLNSIQKVCIGTERKSGKSIYITSKSPTCGLCSQHVENALTTKNKRIRLPLFQFCLLNYGCRCGPPNRNDDTHSYSLDTKFTIPDKWIGYVLNSNYPSSVLCWEVNGRSIGFLFVKTTSPNNIKRMGQPSTFPQFRMSISQSVELTSKIYPGLKILIKSKSKRKDIGVGIGYYYNGRAPNTVDMILCMSDIVNTQFIVRDTGGAYTNQVKRVRCTMHYENASSDVVLLDYRVHTPTPSIDSISSSSTTVHYPAAPRHDLLPLANKNRNHYNIGANHCNMNGRRPVVPLSFNTIQPLGVFKPNFSAQPQAQMQFRDHTNIQFQSQFMGHLNTPGQIMQNLVFLSNINQRRPIQPQMNAMNAMHGISPDVLSLVQSVCNNNTRSA